MRQIFYYVLLICLVSHTIGLGQDFVFSNYQFSPLTVNPANSGSFTGSYRISGAIADKQAAITARPFQNFAISIDARILHGFRKQDWIGVGIQADLIGSSGLIFAANGTANSENAQTWNFYSVGAAYHYSLDKEQTKIFTLGLQVRHGNRKYLRLSQNDARVDTLTGIVDQDINRFNNFLTLGQLTANPPIRDFNVGLLYVVRLKKSELRLGAAMEGLFKPSIGFIKSSSTLKEKTQSGFNFHGSYDMNISNRVSITPGFFYYSFGSAHALNINTRASYRLKPDKDLKLIAGLGFRNLRAAMLFAGVEIGSFIIGLNADFDMSSSVAGSSGVGGFELSCSYIRKAKKKQTPTE
ncbi:MAG: PorP/SprF family type IX secretion system membrane protein [Saprospiraceae bacterium]|nr:PorP/SprF family type IX secretion system membrane protein [Saprospiraceae bacterium]